MKFLQGVKKRLNPKLVRICQYDYPDTKCFGGNVLDDTATINATMEIYCRNVLLLLFPFQSKNDLIMEGSYTKDFILSFIIMSWKKPNLNIS